MGAGPGPAPILKNGETMSEINAESVTDKSQADGAQTISLGSDDKFRQHQLQVELSATPTAGTLDIAIKTPGASAFITLTSLQMDLTSGNQVVHFGPYYASQIKLTPTSLDAGKTWSAFLISGAGA